MISPRPPPPATPAIVAVAITKTAAIRSPARTRGSPSGSSTRARICRSLIPIPRAASTACRSTPATAKYAFVRSGGTPSTTSAAVLFQKPIPRIALPSAIRAMLGNARPSDETPSARSRPRPRCPSQSPSGSASTTAIPSAANDSSAVSPVLSSSSEAWCGMKRTASTKTEAAGREQLGAEDPRLLEGVEDRRSEALADQEGGDRGDGDRGDGRHPHAGEHRRRGQRQLDPQEALQTRHPHPPRRLERLGRHAAQAGDEVPVEHEERVGDEGDLDRRQRQPGERDQELEEGDAGDRVQDVAEGAERP